MCVRALTTGTHKMTRVPGGIQVVLTVRQEAHSTQQQEYVLRP